MKAGRIQIERGMFHVSCEPHVAIKLCRVFGGVRRHQAGEFTMSATPGHAFELDWFRKLHPLTVAPGSERAFRKLIATEKRKLASIAEIEADGYVPRDFELALPPREYQRYAADMLLRTGNLVLADEVGTGKTVSAIAALTAPGVLPAVIVAPTHLPLQWEAEIRRFAPNLVVHRIRSGQPYELGKKRFVEYDDDGKRHLVTTPKKPDVIIINYHKLVGWVETLAKRVCSVFFDEAQELRHSGTNKYIAAKSVAEACDVRCAMSVGPDTRVELAGDVFGSGLADTISAAWDVMTRRGLPSRREGEYEIIDLPAGVRSRSWSGSGFAWMPVKRAIRHRTPPGPMYRVQAGGTYTAMTGDHSVFVATKTELSAIRTAELHVKDVIPVDNGVLWETEPESPFDAISLAAKIPQTQIPVDLRNVSRRDIDVTAWQWQNFHREATFGPRVPVALYLKHRSLLNAVGPVYVGRGKAAALPTSVWLSSWAYVLGFFVGDGWVGGGRVSFAVEQARVGDFVSRLVALDIGLRPEVRRMRGASSEVRCCHLLLARLLETWFGGTRCYDKRLPPAWLFTWSYSARAELLEGLIDSDGHRGSRKRVHARQYTTTSRGLAEDVRLLIRSLGGASTLYRTEPGKGGVVSGRQIVGRRARWGVSWSEQATKGSIGYLGNRCSLPRWRTHMNEAPVRRIDHGMWSDHPDYVYDLEMSGHPSFVANGLLCHNSATPVYNYGGEIFAVTNVVAPGALGSWDEFCREWCGGITAEDVKERGLNTNKICVSDPAALGTYMREAGLMLRRTRKDVGRELPDMTVVRYVVEADADRIREATADVVELAQRMLDRIGTGLERMQWASEIDYRMRLATGMAKAPAVADLVRMLVDSGEQVLLYGYHHLVYDIWRANFSRVNYEIPFAMYTGEENEKQKAESVRRFVAGEAKIMMMSLRAGIGVDGLQKVCAVVVNGELDWSPQVHHQGGGRVHRDGQTRKVVVYFPVATSGSDPVIEDVLGIKAAQANGILNPDDKGDPLMVGSSQDRIQKLAAEIIARHARDGGKTQNSEEQQEDAA